MTTSQYRHEEEVETHQYCPALSSDPKANCKRGESDATLHGVRTEISGGTNISVPTLRSSKFVVLLIARDYKSTVSTFGSPPLKLP